MTSGKFKSFPLDQIIINRDERQRREIDGVEELASSIRRVGLINPPVISRDGAIRAGERRVAACKYLGWTHVPVQFVEDLDEHELQLLELEENVRRVDLPWQDQCRAIERYHQLRSAGDTSWSASKTADALGISEAELSTKRAVAKELSGGNNRVSSAPKYSVARGIVQRDQERKRDSAVQRAVAVTGEGKEKQIPLLNADFCEWQKTYDGPKFNFIHCDFPYGINADQHDQGAGAAMGGYGDTEETYFKLLHCLGRAMENVVAESAHLMFWFSLDYYSETIRWLTKYGWHVNHFPLIWHKSDNAGILPDPHRGPRRVYETCFMASRGDRKIVGPVSNLFAAPTTKYIHMSEKPTLVLQHFFRMIVDEYSVVLDPTCGSANALKVAKQMKAHDVLGIEMNPEFFKLAYDNFDKEAA